MTPTKVITILGIGLIGGSLALCFKERTPCTVYGYDQSEEAIKEALKRGVIDEGGSELAPFIQEADYIFLAVPVGSVAPLLKKIEKISLKPGCIISDVGSTKGKIAQAGRLLTEKGVSFIGGHPMAGSHRSGVKTAHSLLFENAYYILTPLPETPLADVQRLSNLLEIATGAKLVIMNPDHHDRIVGAISHLPHVIAAGLINQVGGYNENNEWFLRLAAGGFRDLTRLAASDPIMWRDILLNNRESLLPLLDDWIKEMKQVRQKIIAKDQRWITRFFSDAQELRQALPEHKGMLPPTYACTVIVPDQPGSIGLVASLLGEKKINLRNIGVVKSREEQDGALRLVFYSQEDLERGVACLRAAKYSVFM